MSVPSQPLYFCFRVPEFAAQAMLRLRPAERTMPVAVVEGVPPLQVVCAANSRARRLGVKRGLSRAELDSFSGLQVLRRSSVEERSASVVLHELAASFTPKFQNITQSQKLAHSTNNNRDNSLLLALDMTGTRRVFGRPEVAARKLWQAARDLGFQAVSARVRISTPQCAWRGRHKNQLPFSYPARRRDPCPSCPSTRFHRAKQRPRHLRYGASARWVNLPRCQRSPWLHGWANQDERCTSLHAVDTHICSSQMSLPSRLWSMSNLTFRSINSTHCSSYLARCFVSCWFVPVYARLRWPVLRSSLAWKVRSSTTARRSPPYRCLTMRFC